MIQQKLCCICTLAAAVLGVLTASTTGCTGMKTSQSQLFGTQGNCQSASITYRIEQNIPPRAAGGPAWAKYLALGTAERPAERRVTTLAVRYPHPAGRAGYARLECIIAAPPHSSDETSKLPGWLKRMGKLADDGLPGISMAEGIHEAMGLDVPVDELSAVLARLEQPDAGVIGAAPGSSQQQVVQVAYALNGAARPPRNQRIAELDKLITRVRRDGSVISHSSNIVESLVNPQIETLANLPTAIPTALMVQQAAPVAVPVAGGAIQPVSHEVPLTHSPAMWRLPPVAPVQ